MKTRWEAGPAALKRLLVEFGIDQEKVPRFTVSKEMGFSVLNFELDGQRYQIYGGDGSGNKQVNKTVHFSPSEFNYN